MSYYFIRVHNDPLPPACCSKDSVIYPLTCTRRLDMSEHTLKRDRTFVRTATEHFRVLIIWHSMLLHLYVFNLRDFLTDSNIYRHRRTHETSQSSSQQQHLNFSDEHTSEHEELESGSVDNESPRLHSNILPTNVNMASMSSMSSSVGLHQGLPSMVAPHMISPHMLQQHI